jgi:hypothetical protein
MKKMAAKNPRSIGVLEYWSVGKILELWQPLDSITPSLQYSTTPVLTNL